MDIVLEIFDTFLFDYAYSKVLPASSFSALGQKTQHAVSSTYSSMREGATKAPQYQYIPASKLFSFEPSQHAYQSQLPRDNMYRQAFSLFLIVW